MSHADRSRRLAELAVRFGANVQPGQIVGVTTYVDKEELARAVADAAYRLLTGPALARLKRCVACPWLFLDRSRNGSRRWCSMEHCGNRAKVRAHRERAAMRRHEEKGRQLW